jgi:acetyl-CoA carboxylase carboxyltransferase component
VGADLVYAWPTAKISIMEASSAVRIMYAQEIREKKLDDGEIEKLKDHYNETQSSPYIIASRGYIDDIIEPAATRKRLIAALEMLQTKEERGPDRKHSTI